MNDPLWELLEEARWLLSAASPNPRFHVDKHADAEWRNRQGSWLAAFGVMERLDEKLNDPAIPP